MSAKSGKSLRPLIGWVVCVFLLSEGLSRLLGIRFVDNTLSFLYQYLDPEILRHELTKGLFFLHAQPPLFNFYLGATLKTFGSMSGAAFSLGFGVLGLALLLAMAWLMEELGVSRNVNRVMCLLLACLPNFMVYRHWLFYTLPAAFLVLCCAVLLARYVGNGRRVDAHLFSWCAAALMLSRAVYHPLWLIAVLLVVVPLLERSRRSALILSAVLPILVINLVFLKNFFQVGAYSGSSWLGMSLAKRWPLSQEEMNALYAEGHLPPVWHRRPFRAPDELRAYGYFQSGESVHPAIDAPYKSNGEPNFNHRDYARISKEILRGDQYLIRRYPDRYLQRVLTSLLLFLQPGPNSVHFLVDYDFTKVHWVRDKVTRFVFLGGAVERPIGMLEPPANLWLIVFPALLVYGCFRTFRRDGTKNDRWRPVFAYITVTVAWVTLTTNLIEIGENDRMRWEIEPLLTILLACALTSAIRRVVGPAVPGD